MTRQGSNDVVKFRRDNNRLVGEVSSGPWDTSGLHAYPATAENVKDHQALRAAAVIRVRRQALVAGIERRVVEAITTEELTSITQIIANAKIRAEGGTGLTIALG